MNFLLALWLCAALLCPLWGHYVTREEVWTKNRTDKCQPATNWTIDGVEPMKTVRGDVVVVVFLKASLPFSLTQASKLNVLRRRLHDNKMTDMSFFIINAQDNESRDKYWDLKNRAPIAVPVFQQEVNTTDLWEILGGEVDDFLIYDRCGRLTYHIGMPWSFYFNPHVQAAIQFTYQINICNCSVTNTTVKAKAREKVTISEGETPETPDYDYYILPHHDEHLKHLKWV